jgi:hypothetical protein
MNDKEKVSGEDVEVVAWLNTLTGDTTSHPVAVMDWDDEGEPVQSLMTVAQHQRITEALRAELETERIRLAACGVVAMANTPESLARARDMHPDYMSASCQDVMRAVDAEIELRAERDQLRAEVDKARELLTQAGGTFRPEGWHAMCREWLTGNTATGSADENDRLRAEVERLNGALSHTRLQASIQAQEARTQKAIVAEIGAMVGCGEDYMTAGAVRAQLAPVQGEAVAWAHYGLVNGEMVIQFPVYASEEKAREALLMYGKKETVEVRPLYTTPSQPAEVGELVEALNFAAMSLAQITSSDGSGHADIALCVLRMAGVPADEREARVEGWKAKAQWRIDAALAKLEGKV